MPLATHVTNRYSSTLLIPLTNANDKSATTVDTTVLGYAVDDVGGDFEIVLGRAYEDAESRDVSVAVEGVVAKLMMRTGNNAQISKDLHDQYLQRLRQLRKKLIPKSSNLRTPTSDLRGKGSRKPTFDELLFDNVVPEQP